MAHGYEPNKEALQKRLKKIEGQVRGVSKMVEGDRYCIDVLTQIGAIQGALDQVGISLLETHISHCVVGSCDKQNQEEKTEELLKTIRKMIGKR